MLSAHTRESFGSLVCIILPVRDYWLGPLSSDKPSVWLGGPVQTEWDPPALRDQTGCSDQKHLQDKWPTVRKTKTELSKCVLVAFSPKYKNCCKRKAQTPALSPYALTLICIY